MALEFWVVALIAAACILGVLVFIWLICEVDSRRRRKRNKKQFEKQVYEQEKNRAEATLATLRAANIERARAPVVACPRGDLPCCGDACSASCGPGPGDYSSGPGYCPECCRQSEGIEASPGYPYPSPAYPAPQQYELAARPLYPPGNYGAQMPPNMPVAPATSPPAMVSWGAMGTPPQGSLVLQQQPAIHPQGALQCVGVIPTTGPPPSVTYASASPAYHYPSRPNATPTGGQGRLRLAENDHELPTSAPPVAPPGFVTVPMVLDRS